jgi:nucleotide-binding universal stress UspA family protein
MSDRQLGRPFGVMLCATRFSPTCEAAMDAAFGLARHFGARLILMHVAQRRADAEQARQRLETCAARAPDLHVETALAYGEPGHALARAAEHDHADLIIIGQARTSDSLVQLGMEEVLARAAPCPVLPIAIGDTVVGAIRHLTSTEVKEKHCVICAKVSGELICEPCRNRVTADALEHKRRIEKAASGH